MYQDSSAQLTERLARGLSTVAAILCCGSQDAIREAAAAGFLRAPYFSIDNSTDWRAIFALSRAMAGLFASRQTLLLIPTGRETAPTRRSAARPRWLACCTTTCC
ncbi:hypothetical protein MJ575_09010 [Klebsiella pneumoniae]|nr:hypothetical protein MJ575_09010 [Klebsiella pneumoniae]